MNVASMNVQSTKFSFEASDFERRDFEIAKSSITLFRHVEALEKWEVEEGYEEQFMLDIEITPETIEQQFGDDEDDWVEICPFFSSQWLNINASEFQSRDLASLDGFTFTLRDEPNGTEEAAAIEYIETAPLHIFDLSFEFVGGNDYRVRSKGEGGFGIRYEFDLIVPMDRAIFRHSDCLRDNSVKQNCHKYFDTDAIDTEWVDHSSDAYPWFDCVAKFHEREKQQ